jgi:hypothetical protein
VVFIILKYTCIAEYSTYVRVDVGGLAVLVGTDLLGAELLGTELLGTELLGEILLG